MQLWVKLIQKNTRVYTKQIKENRRKIKDQLLIVYFLKYNK